MPVANCRCRPSDDLINYSFISCQVSTRCEKCLGHRDVVAAIDRLRQAVRRHLAFWSDPCGSVTQRIVLLYVVNLVNIDGQRTCLHLKRARGLRF